MKCYATGFFLHGIFLILNSKNIIATLRIIAIEKLEFHSFWYYVSMLRVISSQKYVNMKICQYESRKFWTDRSFTHDRSIGNPIGSNLFFHILSYLFTVSWGFLILSIWYFHEQLQLTTTYTFFNDGVQVVFCLRFSWECKFRIQLQYALKTNWCS